MVDKAILIFWFFLLIGCNSNSQSRVQKVNISPIEELKQQLMVADSLIIVGKHREALMLLDTFQRKVKDEVFLTQALSLELHQVYIH